MLAELRPATEACVSREEEARRVMNNIRDYNNDANLDDRRVYSTHIAQQDACCQLLLERELMVEWLRAELRNR